MAQIIDSEYPCALTILTPFPDNRLASTALQALRVDAELSPLVKREFSLTRASDGDGESDTVLKTDYKATTNRMLRVAVNGFMESLGVVLQVMEELDVEVLAEK